MLSLIGIILIGRKKNSFCAGYSKLMGEKEINNFSVDCKTCPSRNRSVFCMLKASELTHFDDHKTCITYKKGQAIFQENGNPLGIYCVNAGKIKIVRIGSEGREQIVRLMKNGDILGYRALFSNTRYNASAITLEDSNVCFIPRTAFFNVLHANSSLSAALIKMLSVELGKAEQNIISIAQKAVKERIAEALLFLKELYGTENDGVTINISLTREDIANLVGTATETVIRLLSAFRQEKTLEFIGKKIKILDIKRLVREANSELFTYKNHVFS